MSRSGARECAAGPRADQFRDVGGAEPVVSERPADGRDRHIPAGAHGQLLPVRDRRRSPVPGCHRRHTAPRRRLLVHRAGSVSGASRARPRRCSTCTTATSRTRRGTRPISASWSSGRGCSKRVTPSRRTASASPPTSTRHASRSSSSWTKTFRDRSVSPAPASKPALAAVLEDTGRPRGDAERLAGRLRASLDFCHARRSACESRRVSRRTSPVRPTTSTRRCTANTSTILSRPVCRPRSASDTRTRMRYAITHVTRFDYDSPVSESHMEVRMQPRTGERQTCLAIRPRRRAARPAARLPRPSFELGRLLQCSARAISRSVSRRAPTFRSNHPRNCRSRWTPPHGARWTNGPGMTRIGTCESQAASRCGRRR